MSRFQQYLNPAALSEFSPANIGELPGQEFTQKNALGNTVHSIVPLIQDGAILRNPYYPFYDSSVGDAVTPVEPSQFQPSTHTEESVLEVIEKANHLESVSPRSRSAFTAVIALADIGFWAEYEKTEGKVGPAAAGLHFELEPFIVAVNSLIANGQQFNWGAVSRTELHERATIEGSRFRTSIKLDAHYEHIGIKVFSTMNERTQINKIGNRATG